MDRRGFLGTMLASLGVLAVDPAQLIWEPTSGLAPVVPGALFTLDAITMEVLRLMTLKWSGTLVQSPDFATMADRHIAWAMMDAPNEIWHTGLDRSQYIEPVAAMLTNELRHKNARFSSELELPKLAEKAVRVTDPKMGLSVLSALQWDLASRRYMLTFGTMYAQ